MAGVLGKQITYKLNNGTHIPGVGLGTWRAEPGQMKKTISYALEEAGYRHIDTATAYGNEHEIGEALEEVFAKGQIKREDVWVTTKLWVTHNGPEDVEAGLDASLKALKLDYVDLYIIHWPIRTRPSAEPMNPKKEDFQPLDEEATWHKLEEMVGKGKAKAIGVSNFSQYKLDNLLRSALVVPAVNQVEVHPGWRNEKIIDFCKSKGIHVEAYSPLGSQGSQFEDPAEHREAPLLEHSIITSVAEKMNKSPGQIMLRWNLQRGLTVLPKSTSPERMKENIDLFGWEIHPEDMDALNKLEPQQKVVDGLFVGKEGSPYQTKEELWDGEI
jgi:diketogulonate reductase-like aldo/keto reductase